MSRAPKTSKPTQNYLTATQPSEIVCFTLLFWFGVSAHFRDNKYTDFNLFSVALRGVSAVSQWFLKHHSLLENHTKNTAKPYTTIDQEQISQILWVVGLDSSWLWPCNWIRRSLYIVIAVEFINQRTVYLYCSLPHTALRARTHKLPKN